MKATSSLGCSRTQPAHWDSHTPQKHGCFLWELGQLLGHSLGCFSASKATTLCPRARPWSLFLLTTGTPRTHSGHQEPGKEGKSPRACCEARCHPGQAPPSAEAEGPAERGRVGHRLKRSSVLGRRSLGVLGAHHPISRPARQSPGGLHAGVQPSSRSPCVACCVYIKEERKKHKTRKGRIRFLKGPQTQTMEIRGVSIQPTALSSL